MRFHKAATYFIPILYLAISSLSQAGVDSETELITGINSSELFKKVVPSFKNYRKYSSSEGVTYLLRNREGTSKLSITIAVFESTTLAKQAIEKKSMMMSIPPSKIKESFGDELRCWRNEAPKSGSAMLRSKNATVYIFGELEIEARLEILKAINEVLISKNTIISKGKVVPIPKVRKVTFSSPIAASTSQDIYVDMEGANTDRGISMTSNSRNAIWKGGRRLTYYAPNKQGKDVIDLTIATKNNVISGYKVKIDVQGKKNHGQPLTIDENND